MGRPRSRYDDDDRGDDVGGAAVRETRVPTGPGPRLDAGAASIPAPPQRVVLPAEPERR